MRITSLELWPHPNYAGGMVTLSFRDPRALNPFNVKQIDGLDADAIIPRFYGSGMSTDPSTGNPVALNFYSAAQQSRQVVIEVQLNPDFKNGQTYSDLRDILYRAISASRTGLMTVRFYEDTDIVAVMKGWVTKFEANLFDKTPSVKITILAESSTLKSMLPHTPDSAEFVHSLVNEPGTSKWDYVMTLTDNLSTAPHGMSMVIQVNEALGSLTIEDPNDPSWSFVVTPEAGFLADDQIRLNSELDSKEIYIRRTVGEETTDIPLADVIQPGSLWPILFPGINHLSIEGGDKLSYVIISYYLSYWGV